MRRESRKSEASASQPVEPANRLIFIGLCVLLMGAAVYLIGDSYVEGQEAATTDAVSIAGKGSVPVEVGVFRQAKEALRYLQTPEKGNDKRTLEVFYSRRAYPGAPPVIPHPVKNPAGYGGKDCLSCHQSGGYTPEFQAYAPVVPHPELLSCRSCHVPAETNRLFRDTDWQTVAANPINQEALPGSPPPIPHTLHMRDNCLACHAGPGAVKEIRVTHPERVNCRQCHVLSEPVTDWQRQPLQTQ